MGLLDHLAGARKNARRDDKDVDREVGIRSAVL
jgi:hypothetical protein